MHQKITRKFGGDAIKDMNGKQECKLDQEEVVVQYAISNVDDTNEDDYSPEKMKEIYDKARLTVIPVT